MSDVFEHNIVVRELQIKNFRIFRDITIDLDDHLNVIIANNGEGKSTLLDALAGHLNYIVDQIKKNALKIFTQSREISAFFPNSLEDINIEAIKNNDTNVEIKTTFNGDYLDFNEEQQPIKSCNLLSQIFSFDDSINFRIVDIENFNISYFIDSIRFCVENNIKFGIPVLVYYPMGTSKKAFSPRNVKQINQFSIYENALNGGALDFIDFVNWFTWLYNKDRSSSEKTILNSIKQAILGILNDDEIVFKDIFIDYSTFPGDFAISKDNINLKFNQLSSGEKSIISFVADLAYRLSVANPHTSDPLAGKGIVLVDEIDLHLHPKWQRKIVSQLRKTFPNIQFIITTHSPLVLESLNFNNIRILQNANVLENDFSPKGREVGEILEELMGQDAVAIQKQINNYFKLISDNELDKAEEYKNNVLLSLTDIENPIFYQANAMINRKKTLGK